MKQTAEQYHYGAHLETLLTYDRDAADSHLTNAYWYVDKGNMLPCNPTATVDANTNKGFMTRWNRLKQSKQIQHYRRLHSDLNNVPLVRLEIR
jgi:hypothetical protein